MRPFLFILCFMLLLSACTSSVPTVGTSAPTLLVPTQSAPATLPPSSPSLYLPSLSRDAQASTGTCEQHAAEMTIATSSPEVRVGELVSVTLSLTNTGECGMLGLLKYTLTTTTDPAISLFNPSNPDPVEHSLGLDPGVSDTASFTLQAVTPGEATLSGSASFEVHLGYPGPAYWANATSPPLTVRVNP